ncbi:MAG TPA: hypothetical protein VFQ00_03465 [Terriglobales bacterium]|nr:hypothetical protein [Terriglobales bacterium]
MFSGNTDHPVVVLKSVAHGGLAIVRSLGRLGVQAYTVEADAWTPAFYSRYNRGSVRLDVESASSNEVLAALEALAQKLGTRAVLVPSTDYAAIFIAEHAASLRGNFLFPQQSPELLRKLYSKREMHYLARAHGIPTAETAFPANRQQVVDFADSAKFPVVLKAIDGTRLNARCGKKMFIVQNREELLRIYDAVEEPDNPNLMLQEYIPGPDDSIWMFDGYFNQHSQCLAAFTGKKLRQCPAFSGYTCLGVCQDNEVVRTTAIRFLQALNYAGLVDIDFRLDVRDGKYKMLDVNPRLGATFSLFTASNGLDLARIYYLDMTGQRVPASTLREGRKWIVGDLDLTSSLRYYKRGQLTLRSWLASLKGIESSAYFALDDPLPMLARAAADSLEAARRISRRLPSLRRKASQSRAQSMNTVPETRKAEAA